MSAIARILLSTMTCWLVLPPAMGQTPPRTPTTDQTVVFRATTELVQTDVTVLDKEGRFVEGLRREDFDLRIDGNVKPIQFFERIAAGSGNEESQLVAAQRTTSSRTTGPVARAPLDRGRTIFFYVDDLHLDLASLNATQKLVGDFVEEEMSQNDEVAIASASGQVGFLQQLTDNKTVLRLALQRIKLRPNSVRDLDRPPMTEYQALLIDKYDRDVTAFFVQETMRNNPGISGAQAENLVKGRSRALLQQADQTTAHTFSGLESLIRASTKLPGRKLVFFVSGGFLLNSPERASNLRRIASAAARTGTVIYTVDARGLVASLLDPSIAEAANIATRLAHGEEGTQDAAVRIARRIFNDRGQSGGDFNDIINVTDEGVRHTHQILLGPGLYRVQVAAQDVRSGRIGSADAWIEVPNLAGRHLALSSLIIGARRLAPATVTNDADEAQRALANISITRRFQRDADLRFFLFTYNAARADSRPDLAIQVQLLRDNRTVLKTALRKMPTENADLDGLPYAADLSLADLPPGRYALEVTVVDRVAGTSAVQQARFEIE